jgi:hypothetical protein
VAHLPGRKTFAYDIARGKADSGSDQVFVDEWMSGAVERHRIHEDSRRLTEGLQSTVRTATTEKQQVLEQMASPKLNMVAKFNVFQQKMRSHRDRLPKQVADPIAQVHVLSFGVQGNVAVA